MEITYYTNNRMKYHPEFHFNHGKVMTEEEMEYLCYFYDVDDLQSLAFALGRTESTLSHKYYLLKKQGKVEQYKARYREKLKGE